MGLLGSIMGTNGAFKKNLRDLEAAKTQAQNMYNKQMNEDYTQSQAAQAALSNARDALDAKYNQAAGNAAVMGATDESVALQKDANNQTIGDTTRQIAAQGTANRNDAMQNYINVTKSYTDSIAGQRAAQAQQEAAAFGQLAGAVIGGGTSIASSYINKK